MKTTLKLAGLLFTVAGAIHAQVVPEASVGTATFSYAARYAQVAEFYGNGLGASQEAILSGDANYMNGHQHLPFNMVYGGGYGWNLAGPSYGSGLFENFLASQGFVRRSWSLVFSDNTSYRKQAPTAGFSGVPGTGEPVGGSSPTPPSSQTILTLNTRTVDNNATGTLALDLNYATVLSFGAVSELLRYPDGNGVDTDTFTANAVLTRRINARSSLSGQYLYTKFTYPGGAVSPYNGGMWIDTILIGYQRQWNRQITTNVSAGPQWVEGADSAIVPTSTRVSASATITDRLRFGTADIAYTHNTSGGGGFLMGSEVDSVAGGFTKDFERKLTIGLTGGYMRNSGLTNQEEINATFGTATASMRLSRNFNAFASYTGSDQSSSSSLPSNAVGQLYQVISFGIGYSSPREQTRSKH